MMQVISLFPGMPLPPRWFDGPPGWMWHGVQAIERGEAIVVDWIGYDVPDHFLGPDAVLRAMMVGRRVISLLVGAMALGLGYVRRCQLGVAMGVAALATSNRRSKGWPSPRIWPAGSPAGWCCPPQAVKGPRRAKWGANRRPTCGESVWGNAKSRCCYRLEIIR